jgi:hypothetical protein
MKLMVIPLVLWMFLLATAQRCLCQQRAKDSVLSVQLLSQILYFQKHHSSDFANGLIPSYREYEYQKDILKDDDNIFFTGLVTFTLRSIQPFLNNIAQKICDSIITHSAPRFSSYQNQKGRPTYNFWRTDKSEIFPNSGWLNLFNKSQALPDDLDDTAIMLLALNSDDSTVASAHRLMQGFTNNNLKKVKSTLSGYKHIRAYSTWFGKRMPVDLDFCVLTNILLMVEKYRIPYTAADSASVEFIEQVIKNRHYVTAAARVSPHYNRSPVLFYHLSRLMKEAEIPALEKWKPQLIADATTAYKQSHNFFDKIILSTSLMRWGVILDDDFTTVNTSLKSFVENYDFIFFIANITSMLPTPLNTLAGKTGIGKFYYYCPSYNYTLLLENMVLRERIIDKKF